MKVSILIFLSFFVCLSAAKSQTNNVDGERSLKVVKSILAEKKIGFASGYNLKQNISLGDSSATALKIIFTEDEILLKENLWNCLSIFQVSFAEPEKIWEKKD